jgi:hypothetical protein
MGVSDIPKEDLISASDMEVKYPSALRMDALIKLFGVMKSGAVKLADAMVQNRSHAILKDVPTLLRKVVHVYDMVHQERGSHAILKDVPTLLRKVVYVNDMALR